MGYLVRAPHFRGGTFTHICYSLMFFGDVELIIISLQHCILQSILLVSSQQASSYIFTVINYVSHVPCM
jgi:hypothetical protein